MIKAGSRERVMYVIIRGEVAFVFFDGTSVITVADLGKGDFTGEVSFFCDSPLGANVIADTDYALAVIESLPQRIPALQSQICT